EPERFVRSSESVAGQQYPRSESTSRIGGSGRGTIRESGSREYTATRTTRQVVLQTTMMKKKHIVKRMKLMTPSLTEPPKVSLREAGKIHCHLSTRRDFEPTGYGHGGMERRRNELSTTTRSHETTVPYN
ncbi:hypothetical protein LOAG_00961, partial [Loa loa]